MKQHNQFNAFTFHRALLALAAGILCSGSLLAQTPAKKPAPAPAKPAAKPAAPAAKPGAASAAKPGAASAAKPGAAPAAKAPITTGGAHPTTTAGAHPTTTAGARPGAPGAAHATPVSAHGAAMSHPAPKGAHDVHGPKGDVRMRADGRPSDIHRPGMDIHHNLGGGRRVGFDRPGGVHGYYERGRPGYIGHPYMAHGYEFNRRTYYYNGRAYDRFYRPYGYHGFMLDVYAPRAYFGVGFYGWAYNPWVAPVPYAWGFAAAPWYGVYGAYFTPYPVYAAPSLWLTDYLISQTLVAAYQAQAANAAVAAAYAGPPLDPATKDLVAAEVKREIALENAEAAQNAQQQAPDPASSGIARLLSDGQSHVFVAGKEVDVTDGTTGQECALTDGDVVQLSTPPGPADTTANVVVLASKGGQDCRRTAVVAIGLDELQDMNNHMRETLDAGLQELQSKQGKGGLPAAPPSAATPPATALVAQDAPPPDPAGAKELEDQAKASEAAEQEALAQTPGAPGAVADAAPAPATSVSISPGQSTDDVKGALGTPTRVVNLGAKTMYFYKDMKVTFVNGKVTNIE